MSAGECEASNLFDQNAMGARAPDVNGDGTFCHCADPSVPVSRVWLARGLAKPVE